MKDTRKETYAQIALRVREIPLDRTGAKYEWEELVQRMCDSDDAGLREIGRKEYSVLKQKYV